MFPLSLNTSHLLTFINVVLFGFGLVLVIYISRRRIIPLSTYCVEKRYADPCDSLLEFAESWRSRWTSKHPQYHVSIILFPLRE